MNRPNWIIMMQQSGILLLVCGLILAGCGYTQHISYSRETIHHSAPAKKTLVSAECGHNPVIQPGTSANVTVAVTFAVSLGEHTRLYRVHVPTSYRADHPQPVVFVFHGYAGTAAGMERTTSFSLLADQQDFLAIYPQGMIEPRLGKPFFAELGPIDYGVDEVSFVSAMLNDLQAKFCIDTARVFSTGFSNGGGLSALLACRFAQRIAAIAPVEGPFNDIPGGCHPVRPVSVLDVHGTNDQSVPYDGIPISKDPRGLTRPSSNGCKIGRSVTVAQVGQPYSCKQLGLLVNNGAIARTASSSLIIALSVARIPGLHQSTDTQQHRQSGNSFKRCLYHSRTYIGYTPIHRVQ